MKQLKKTKENPRKIADQIAARYNKLKENTKNPSRKLTTEQEEEDPVDTITMDIPLFLRMLEYSREDASQDMDLHDVTEKANELGKEKGTLTMEDYDLIVGDTEKNSSKPADELKEIILRALKGKKLGI